MTMIRIERICIRQAHLPIRVTAAQGANMKMFTLKVLLNNEHRAFSDATQAQWRRTVEANLEVASVPSDWYLGAISVSFDFDGVITDDFVSSKTKRVLSLARTIPEAVHGLEVLARKLTLPTAVTGSYRGERVQDRCNFYCGDVRDYVRIAVIPFEFVGGFDAFLQRFQKAAELFTRLCLLQKRKQQALALLEESHNIPAAIEKLDDIAKLASGLMPLIPDLWNGMMPREPVKPA